MLEPTGIVPDHTARPCDRARVRRNHDWIFNRRRMTPAQVRDIIAECPPDERARWEEYLDIITTI